MVRDCVFCVVEVTGGDPYVSERPKVRVDCWYDSLHVAELALESTRVRDRAGRYVLWGVDALSCLFNADDGPGGQGPYHGEPLSHFLSRLTGRDKWLLIAEAARFALLADVDERELVDISK